MRKFQVVVVHFCCLIILIWVSEMWCIFVSMPITSIRISIKFIVSNVLACWSIRLKQKKLCVMLFVFFLFRCVNVFAVFFLSKQCIHKMCSSNVFNEFVLFYPACRISVIENDNCLLSYQFRRFFFGCGHFLFNLLNYFWIVYVYSMCVWLCWCKIKKKRNKLKFALSKFWSPDGMCFLFVFVHLCVCNLISFWKFPKKRYCIIKCIYLS